MWSYFGYFILAAFVLLATGLLNPVLRWLFEERHFSGLELQAILSWRDSLTAENRDILDRQLELINLVQKGMGGAKVAAYYTGSQNVPLFSTVEPNVKVATVEFADSSVLVATPLRARIYVHRGQIFSVEYPKPPKRFATKHGLDVSELQVSNLVIHLKL